MSDKYDGEDDYQIAEDRVATLLEHESPAPDVSVLRDAIEDLPRYRASVMYGTTMLRDECGEWIKRSDVFALLRSEPREEPK